MSYQLNKTDGTILTDLIDGQIDIESTNLTLVGRNYTGYGEAFNENFIRLLENFANSAAPTNPLSGQIWWDTSEQRLKVYDGTVWKASGGPYVQETRPQMVSGDLWIDNLNNQMYAYDGAQTILIGPSYTASQGKSGFEIVSILDTQSRSRTIAKFNIGSMLVGIFSAVEFTPIYAQRILGLVTETNTLGTIYEGFNIINPSTFKWYGIAQSSNALVTASGAIRTADQFLPSDSNGITVGTLTIQNSGGITIGTSQNNVQKVVGPRFYIENQLRDHDLSLRIRSTAYESIIVDALYIDASEGKIGIFTTNRLPEYTLDVEGDLRVTGDLIVQGNTTNIEVTTLRVEDKNIELAYSSEGLVNDLVATGGGITLLSSEGNKTITWESSTDSWTFNRNVDLNSNTLAFSINNSIKLTNDSLSNILYADDLVRIGTLQFLDVDTININSNTITSSVTLNVVATGGIALTPNGDISIAGSYKITGLANPTSAQDAATKTYVDTQILTTPITFSLDITALGSGLTLQTNVAGYLNDLYPAIPANTGKIARLHTVSYSGATVTGVDVEAIKNISFVAVDSNGTQNESAVQDVVFDPAGASGAVVLTPIRGLMVMQSNGSAWAHVSTTVYP